MTGAVTARTLDRAVVVLTPSVAAAEMICDRAEREEMGEGERREGEKEGEMVKEEKEEREVGEGGRERGKEGKKERVYSKGEGGIEGE